MSYSEVRNRRMIVTGGREFLVWTSIDPKPARLNGARTLSVFEYSHCMSGSKAFGRIIRSRVGTLLDLEQRPCCVVVGSFIRNVGTCEAGTSGSRDGYRDQSRV